MTVHFAMYGCSPEMGMCVAHEQPLLCIHCCAAGDNHPCATFADSMHDAQQCPRCAEMITVFEKMLATGTMSEIAGDALKKSVARWKLHTCGVCGGLLDADGYCDTCAENEAGNADAHHALYGKEDDEAKLRRDEDDDIAERMRKNAL